MTGAGFLSPRSPSSRSHSSCSARGAISMKKAQSLENLQYKLCGISSYGSPNSHSRYSPYFSEEDREEDRAGTTSPRVIRISNRRLETANSEIKRLGNEIEEKDKEIKKLKTIIFNLKEKFKDNAFLKMSLETVSSELQMRESEITQLNNKLTKKKQELVEKKQEIERLFGRVHELETNAINNPLNLQLIGEKSKYQAL